MKTSHLKLVIFLFLLVMSGKSLLAQTVIDPALKDPNYELKKQAAKPTGQKPVSSTKQNQQADFGCNVDNNCFIPLDNSYIALPRNDDGSYGPINLPFTFDLYGSQYNQLYINTNGNLTFNGSYSGYVAAGFPIGIPMVAAFWQDVDTRNSESGEIYYQLSATHLIVTWNGVGYYNSHADKLNTFQIVISALGDPLLGGTNNVKFAYKKMQWALPDGSAPYGPATVGINKGNNVDYVQVGRFDKENCDYDGPLGNNDGIGYLENQCFLFNVSSGVGNFPPSVSGLPANDSITLNVGETANLNPQFIGPEGGQTVTTVVDTTGLCNAIYTISNGEVSTVNMQITGSDCNVGTHIINFKATDNGVPPQTTSVDITVIVNKPDTDTTCKNVCITDNFGYVWKICYHKRNNFNEGDGTVDLGSGVIWKARGWLNCKDGLFGLHAVNPNADNCASGYVDSFVYRGISYEKCNMAAVHVGNGNYRSFCSGSVVNRGTFSAVNCGSQADKVINPDNSTPAKSAKGNDIVLKVSPNPVQNAATITYTVAKDSKVNIVVYNYMMQPIKTLVSGSKAAGNYSVIWNVNQSSNVGSGLYKVVAIVDGKSYTTTIQVTK